MHKTWDSAIAENALSAFATTQDALLPMLHALQAEFGCLPAEATPFLAAKLNLTRAEVHGVIGFYPDFRREPHGEAVVRMCRAEACQAMGAREAAEALLSHFKIGWGQTSADGAVTVEPVYCLGLCAAAPAALVDGKPVARLSAASLIAAIEAKQ